jgi:hypothetical protein
MDALWHGVQTGSYRPALPAFFPLGAYIQVKAIADPVADYQARLVGGYKLDVAAAHALLGPDAPRAALLAVNVPDAYAHWVPPGACYNRVGCAELAARVSSRRFCAVVRDRVVDLVARGLVRGPPRRGGAFRSGWGGRRSEQRTGSAGALLHLLRRRLRDAAAG